MIKKVIFDTDCLSSFLWVGREDIILNLYNSLIIIPDDVYNEISKINHLKSKVDSLISNNRVTTMSIYLNTSEFIFFTEMTTSPKITRKIIGRGEASAIALARYNNGIVASNNLRDINIYIKHYNLDTITTPDILLEALKKGFITEYEGNNIWSNMIIKRRKLPFANFTDYLNSLS